MADGSLAWSSEGGEVGGLSNKATVLLHVHRTLLLCRPVFGYPCENKMLDLGIFARPDSTLRKCAIFGFAIFLF